MLWTRISSLSSLLLWYLLLFVNFQGNYMSEAGKGGLLGARENELSQRPLGSTPAEIAYRRNLEEKQDQPQETGKVGLLNEDPSTERRVLGVLDRQPEDGKGEDSRASENGSNGESEGKSNTQLGGEEKQCTAACKKEWLGDGWCDSACNTKECEYDAGDCEGWCSGDCKPTWLGDGYCDAACYVPGCQWDEGDCEEWRRQGVKAIERRLLLQKEKQLKQHRLKLPDCKCEHRLLVNGSCTPECNVPECLFDGGECLNMCNSNCGKSWLGDGECDKDCDTPECGYDKGDCDSSTNFNLKAAGEFNGVTDACTSSCRLWMIGNTICDTQCNNVACGYDGGDCDNVSTVIEVNYSSKPEVYQFCAREWIGDGHCDPNCYNKPSKWDGGDCEGTEFEKKQADKGIGPEFE